MTHSIRNDAGARQLITWPTLQYNRIAPSDIDWAIEFGNELFLLGEVKSVGAPFNQGGQRWMLERMCDAIAEGGKQAYVIVSEHNVPTSVDVDLSKTRIRMVRHNGEWIQFPKGNRPTVEAYVSKLLLQHRLGRYVA